MNALFLTQGNGLRFLARLCDALTPRLGLGATGFYVCDSMFFRAFAREQPGFASKHVIVKEWEIVAASRGRRVDLADLQRREAGLREPLWNALLCDRRVMLGRWCKERQDYRPRYDHAGMLALVDAGVHAFTDFFDCVRPDVVFSFVPVTFGEYLAHLLAAERGIPVLSLYPTKIRNYMAWMSSIFGRADHIVEAYDACRRSAAGAHDPVRAAAESYVREVGGTSVRHEGMIPIPGRLAAGRRSSARAALRRLISGELEYWTTESRRDPHVDSILLRAWQREVGFRVRRARVQQRLRSHLASAEQLARGDYCFFPLHAEPEVSLMIQGRPFVNQIELVRNVARSLPAGMRLVVKEHPRSIGYRSFGYYRKLLEIPNVQLADPMIEARELIAGSRFVATVWSFVGFEAVLNRRPVLLFGTPLYGVLPESMVRRSVDPHGVPDDVRALLGSYVYNERAVVDFVAACMRSGVPLDFYARYLGKRGRYGASEAAPEGEFEEFLSYTVDRVRATIDRTSAVGTA